MGFSFECLNCDTTFRAVPLQASPSRGRHSFFEQVSAMTDRGSAQQSVVHWRQIDMARYDQVGEVKRTIRQVHCDRSPGQDDHLEIAEIVTTVGLVDGIVCEEVEEHVPTKS